MTRRLLAWCAVADPGGGGGAEGAAPPPPHSILLAFFPLSFLPAILICWTVPPWKSRIRPWFNPVISNWMTMIQGGTGGRGLGLIVHIWNSYVWWYSNQSDLCNICVVLSNSVSRVWSAFAEDAAAEELVLLRRIKGYLPLETRKLFSKWDRNMLLIFMYGHLWSMHQSQWSLGS